MTAGNTLTDLMNDLRERRVELWADGNALRYRAPKGYLPAALLGRMQLRKAEIIELLQHSADASGPPLIPRSTAGELPLTTKDEWFVSYYGRLTDVGICHPCIVCELIGELDATALQRSIHALLARHSILSLRYYRRSDGSRFARLQHPEPAYEPETVDIGAIAADLREGALSELIEHTRLSRFDVDGGGLLWRMKLLKLDQHAHVLVMVIYHSICDAVSRTLLTRDLACLYEAATTNEPAQLPPLQISFRDYMLWLPLWVQSGTGRRSLEYWRSRFRGLVSPFALPDEVPDRAVVANGAAVSLEIDSRTTLATRDLAMRSRSTTAIVLLAAVAVALGAWNGRTDICIAVLHSGRVRGELQDVVGCCAGAWVLRVDLSGMPDFAEVVSRVRSFYADSTPHLEVPYVQMRELLREECGEPGAAILVNHIPQAVRTEAEGSIAKQPQLLMRELQWNRAPGMLDELTGQKLMISIMEGATTISVEVLHSPRLSTTAVERFCAAVRAALVQSQWSTQLASHPG
jgi:hypothetical protein